MTFISANGFQDTPSNNLPNIEQVEFCKQILSFIKQKSKYNYRNSSYGYKHSIEYNYEKGYITNGSLLLAGEQLNLDIERDKSNGYFKFTSDDLKLAIINYYANKTTVNLENSKSISEIINNTKVKSYNLSIHQFYEFLNRKYVNIKTTPFEIFLIFIELGISIKYQSCLSLQGVHTDSISWSRDFYIPISISKLNKLFKQKLEDMSANR